MILLLASCARFEAAKPFYIDPRADEFVKEFEQMYGTVTVSIYFTDIADEDTAGVCHIRGNYRYIEIDEPYWNEITKNGQEWIIFHELGHCELKLDHNETLGTVGAWSNVPVSIMYPVVFGDDEYYAQNRIYYLNELKYEH